MNFSSFLSKPSSPRPKSLRSMEAEKKTKSSPDSPTTEKSSEKTPSAEGKKTGSSRGSVHKSSVKSTTSNRSTGSRKSSSTLYATTAASRARQKAAAESLSRSGSTVGKRKDGSGLGTFSSSVRSLDASGSQLERKKHREIGGSVQNVARTERRKLREGGVTATGRRASTSGLAAERTSKEPTLKTGSVKRKQRTADVRQKDDKRTTLKTEKSKSTTSDDKTADDLKKEQRRKEKKRSTKDKDRKEPSSRDEKPKSSHTKDSTLKRKDSTSSRDSREERKKKSSDSKSLSRKVARLLSGAKTPDLVPTDEESFEATESQLENSAPGNSSSYGAEGSVEHPGIGEETELFADGIKEVFKWPWNIRIVRTISLKNPFDRTDPKRSSDPVRVGTSEQVILIYLLTIIH